MSLTSPNPSTVLLTYRQHDHATGQVETVERHFHATPEGAVLEKVGGDWRQVCRNLERTGATLRLRLAIDGEPRPFDTLPHVILQEANAMLAADKASPYPSIEGQRLRRNALAAFSLPTLQDRLTKAEAENAQLRTEREQLKGALAGVLASGEPAPATPGSKAPRL